MSRPQPAPPLAEKLLGGLDDEIVRDNTIRLFQLDLGGDHDSTDRPVALVEDGG